jgi:hypothetical protein
MGDVIKIHVAQTITDAGYPKLKLKDVSVTGAQLVGKIYWVTEGQVFTISAVIDNKTPGEDGELIAIPFGDVNMSTPVEEIVDGKAVKTLRFQSQIRTDEAGIVQMKLPLKLPSGNYFISQERINRGLEEIAAPFRFAFDSIDIDSQVVVA